MLKSVAHFCTNLQTLHLSLDRHSIMVSYDLLELAFLRTQSRLTTVSVKLDTSVVNVSILWTLCRLPYLTHLGLQVYGTIDLAVLVTETLGCCPGLESLTLERWIPNTPRPLLKMLKANVKRKMASRFNQSPKTVQEAVGRNELAPIRLGSPLPVAQPLQRFPSTMESSTITNNIRRLDLCMLLDDVPVFDELIKSCSQLNDFHLRDELIALDHQSWTTLSSRCPNLWTLRLTGKKSRLLIGSSVLLIPLFPRLESLHVHLQAIQWTDWATTNVDRCLAEHEQKFGTRHPLKTLSLTSDNTTSLPIISCILAARSLDIQTLTVGSLWRSQDSYDIDPVHGASASRFLINLSQEHLRSPWHALRETLVQLDMHTTIIATKDITRTFLRRLQDLPKLRALCVSTRHIHDWVPPSYRALHFIWKGELPVAHTFGQSSVVDSIGVNHGDFFTIKLPTVSYSFAPLREFFIKSYPFGHGGYKDITIEQALFVLAAMPGLEYFVAEDGVISKESLEELKEGLPKQFRPLPKDYLAWIDAVHGYK